MTSLAQMEAKLRSYRQSSLSELISVFGAWMPFGQLKPKPEKANSRCRDYSLAVTFWAFLWQVLTPQTPCREVVRKVQSFCSELKLKIPGSSNVAYCKARARLPVDDVDAVHASVLQQLVSRVRSDQCWLDYREGKCLGPHDRLVVWTRSAAPLSGWTREEWNALPKELTLRIVRIKIEIKGMRVHRYDLVATLTDASIYTKDDLADLYFRRWAVELYFRQIKTTMGMEKLRCRTPDMVRKELRMHLIAYNLIRGLMQEAAHLQCARLDRISFKGAVDTLRQFASALNATKTRPRTQQRVIEEMLTIIAKETVPERKYRSEPRAVKERPKPYPRLTSHRSVYIVPKSRKIKGTAKTKSIVETP